jgi:glycerol-3-phosphate acyltransferase PlsX
VIRIALDAMGGDSAPDIPVAGAVQAVLELPGSYEIQLVGRRAEIEAALARHPDVPEGRITIVDAPDVIEMGDKPLAAIRGKRKSSMRVALELQKAGESDAFISAGNTGAVMAGSTLLLGLHDGVQRTAIGALFPTRSDPVLVVDGGANIDCSPRELWGFAHIGVVYARDVLGRENPTVGLLNIGEEEEKGNQAVIGAHELLKADERINFVGNVEGRGILGCECDVVVCDGFVGNVLLKFYESIAHLFGDLLKREIEPEVLESKAMGRVFRVLDYAEYGGAPLLGVRGVAIICHGRSPARAIKNAIGVAVQAVKVHLSQHIAAEMAGDEAVA